MLEEEMLIAAASVVTVQPTRLPQLVRLNLARSRAQSLATALRLPVRPLQRYPALLPGFQPKQSVGSHLGREQGHSHTDLNGICCAVTCPSPAIGPPSPTPRTQRFWGA